MATPLIDAEIKARNELVETYQGRVAQVQQELSEMESIISDYERCLEELKDQEWEDHKEMARDYPHFIGNVYFKRYRPFIREHRSAYHKIFRSIHSDIADLKEEMRKRRGAIMHYQARLTGLDLEISSLKMKRDLEEMMEK